MKVPKYIIEKMHRLARLSAEAEALSAEIDDYFERKGIDPDELRGASFMDVPSINTHIDYLTELECGNDVTDEFIDYLIAEYSEY